MINCVWLIHFLYWLSCSTLLPVYNSNIPQTPAPLIGNATHRPSHRVKACTWSHSSLDYIDWKESTMIGLSSLKYDLYVCYFVSVATLSCNSIKCLILVILMLLYREKLAWTSTSWSPVRISWIKVSMPVCETEENFNLLSCILAWGPGVSILDLIVVTLCFYTFLWKVLSCLHVFSDRKYVNAEAVTQDPLPSKNCTRGVCMVGNFYLKIRHNCLIV